MASDTKKPEEHDPDEIVSIRRGDLDKFVRRSRLGSPGPAPQIIDPKLTQDALGTTGSGELVADSASVQGYGTTHSGDVSFGSGLRMEARGEVIRDTHLGRMRVLTTEEWKSLQGALDKVHEASLGFIPEEMAPEGSNKEPIPLTLVELNYFITHVEATREISKNENVSDSDLQFIKSVGKICLGLVAFLKGPTLATGALADFVESLNGLIYQIQEFLNLFGVTF